MMTMMRNAVLLTGLTMISTQALAKGEEIEAGKALAATCVACHGEDGVNGTLPTYPIIAGQYKDYLVKALKEYRDGARKNIIMGSMAAALSDDDIKNLAAYYASLPGPLSILPQD